MEPTRSTISKSTWFGYRNTGTNPGGSGSASCARSDTTDCDGVSHQDEKDFHDIIVKNLQSTYRKLQARIDQAYIDKLDGKISEEFWTERNQDWRREQDQIQIKLQAHQKANANYLQEGIRI